MQSIIPINTGFGESNGDPSGSQSDNPTKDTSTVPIIKTESRPSENTTKVSFYVTRELNHAKPCNIIIYYISK